MPRLVFCLKPKVPPLFDVVFVKSSDKLLNYLMLDPELIEVKLETLKTHEFHPW